MDANKEDDKRLEANKKRRRNFYLIFLAVIILLALTIEAVAPGWIRMIHY